MEQAVVVVVVDVVMIKVCSESREIFIPRKVGPIWLCVIDQHHDRSTLIDLVLINGQQSFIAFYCPDDLNGACLRIRAIVIGESQRRGQLAFLMTSRYFWDKNGPLNHAIVIY